MKKIILGLALLLCSVSAFADKVVIKGEPVVIEKQGDMYVPASTFTTSDYYYVSVNNTKRVCYQEVQPALAKIDMGIFAMKVGSDVVKVHCYDYSPDYFVIQ